MRDAWADAWCGMTRTDDKPMHAVTTITSEEISRSLRQWPRGEIPEARPLWLARCELGASGRVYQVTTQQVRLLHAEKRLAVIDVYKPTAWLFDARRTSLGRLLCRPGAAATATSAVTALDVATTLLERARREGLLR